MTAPVYRSPFATWLEKSAVRAMPRVPWIVPGEGRWFPNDAWSIAAHPAVLASGRAHLVAAELLAGYLDFTIQLESACIGPVSRDLALERLGARYCNELARDALRLQCDETFHALLCHELRHHVLERTGLPPPPLEEHRFLRHVRLLREQLAPLVPPELVDFCAAVVAETVITKTLLKDWDEAELRPEVREFLLRHYKDELRHGAFFAQALRTVWPQWEDAFRRALEPHWTELTCAFVAPDPNHAFAALLAVGFSAQDARPIVRECANHAAAATDVRASISGTLAALRDAGVASERVLETTVA
jgi:P-aminobenzoate N-oxygenase AurF